MIASPEQLSMRLLRKPDPDHAGPGLHTMSSGTHRNRVPGLACERASDRDLEDIAQWLRVLLETLDEPEAGGHADFMFHQAIVAASHSPSLTTLYAALSTLLKQSHIERRRTTYASVAIIGDLVEAHREVFLAIVGQDPNEADRRLREHFAIGDELRRKGLLNTYRKTVGQADPNNQQGRKTC